MLLILQKCIPEQFNLSELIIIIMALGTSLHTFVATFGSRIRDHLPDSDPHSFSAGLGQGPSQAAHRGGDRGRLSRQRFVPGPGRAHHAPGHKAQVGNNWGP